MTEWVIKVRRIKRKEGEGEAEESGQGAEDGGRGERLPTYKHIQREAGGKGKERSC